MNFHVCRVEEDAKTIFEQTHRILVSEERWNVLNYSYVAVFPDGSPLLTVTYNSNKTFAFYRDSSGVDREINVAGYTKFLSTQMSPDGSRC